MAFEEVEETQVLGQFRNQVADLQFSDGTLRRFLRARNHDLSNAEGMLRNAAEWRRVNNVDKALEWNIKDVIVQQFPFAFSGVDYQNRCVAYAPLGAWPIRETIDAGYKDELLLHAYKTMESLMQEIKKTGEEQFTLIVDLAECTYWKFTHFETMQIVYRVIRDFEANYPERLGEAYIINAPFYFNYTWALIKPILAGTTLSKISFLSGNEDSYIPMLLEKMPASSVPSKLRKFIK